MSGALHSTAATWTVALALSALAGAQDAPAAEAPAQEPVPVAQPDFGKAADGVQQKLAAAIAELSALRTRIADEKLPLARRMSELEGELAAAREESQETSRALDGRAVELSRLTGEISKLENEEVYLANLFGEYVRNLEAGLHIAEVQRYEETLEAAKLAADNDDLERAEVYRAQAALLEDSLERLDEVLGGTRFEGEALDIERRVVSGAFVNVGPVTVFRSDDGAAVGVVEQRLGSLEPSLVAFGSPEDQAAAAALVQSGRGVIPFDPTLGNASKIESTEDTFMEHVQKGGPVMIPIFSLAGAAMLVALLKWISFLFVRTPSKARVQALYDAVAKRDEAAVTGAVARIKGPVGRMLKAGVDNLREPRELVEEVMYEVVLTSRLKLERFLPFVAISAASAPLLGLLGTVTGIINTFKLITVSGSGDVKSLSGGISEALITTEFGLIVAIPSLLLHAFLSRKARGVVGKMETAAIGLVNQLGKTPWASSDATGEDVLVPAARQSKAETDGRATDKEPAHPGSTR